MATNSLAARTIVLALRAHAHLATARLIIDMTLDIDSATPEPTVGQLHALQSEVNAAAGYVREIATGVES